MTAINQQDTPALTPREVKDLYLLALFAAVYCRARHQGPRAPLDTSILVTYGVKRHHLCAECRDLLHYACERRIKCPLDPKPACKHCPVHCYRSAYRARVREIMRVSGRHLILRGRLDLLWHYFF